MEHIRCCIDRAAPPSSLQNDVDERLFGQASSWAPDRATALTSTLWIPHQTITIGFLHDERESLCRRETAGIEHRLQHIAREWTQYANLHFEFVEGPASIRISFDAGGSWSYIGRQCLEIPMDQPTMNFGWLTKDLLEGEFRRVVLHEFGHALGCVHEHQHPANGIKWNRPVVYQYYEGLPNFWQKSDVDRNIFSRYATNLTRHTAVDDRSIMMYPIPATHTEDGYSVGWNDQLSEPDKEFISQLYPR
jgi:hypothetical protein